MKILQTFTPDIAAYSIDKSFLDLSPLPSSPVQHLHNESTILIDIPFTIDIASTKTLEIESSLKQAVSYIWIIGRALTLKLKKPGLYTAHDLALKNLRWERTIESNRQTFHSRAPRYIRKRPRNLSITHNFCYHLKLIFNIIKTDDT